MAQYRLLKKIVEALEKSGTEYFITGSIASSIYGEPRLSHDIDIVADYNRSNIDI